MKDYYLKNLNELRGQPKRTIADYVESQGILVPRRFDSLKEGRKSHKAILLRSEHPQEYGGVSGMLDSFQLSSPFVNVKRSNNVEEAKQGYLKGEEESHGTPVFKQYCNFLSLDAENFKDQVSFSIWEKLKGYNRTVVADSAIKGRYHIMTFEDGGNHLHNYCIFESGNLREHVHESGLLTSQLVQELPELVKDYERVRNLDNFDQNHCPIMEFQTVNGRNFFLQYHRGRDFKESTFKLDRKPKKGEVEMQFVRGATSKEGIKCKTTLYYFTGDKERWSLPSSEEGSFDLHYNSMLTELMVRKRKFQFIGTNANDGLNWTLKKFVVNHNNRSKLFKPEVSVIGSVNSVIPDSEIDEKLDKMIHEKKDSNIDLHIISDGNKAYVKRVN